MRTSPLPNWLSTVRILLAPGALTAALAGSRPWFAGLLAAGLLTDALDGYLARRLHAETSFGRKLDSAADYVTLLNGVAGIALLWPEIMRRELPWVLAGLGAFFAVIFYGYSRLGRAPCYHTWAAKVFTVACAVSLIPLLAEGAAWPFRVAIALQILAGIEELAIAMLIPKHEGEVPTLWHAWRLRRAGSAQSTPPPGSANPWPR
jgi:phosphatidylglycerophosphate synthase